MKIKNFIKKIQRKPKSARILILWISTLVAMIIIVAIWFFSFSRGLGEKSEKENLEIPSLFESIKTDFSTFKEQFNEEIEGEEINQQDLKELLKANEEGEEQQ